MGVCRNGLAGFSCFFVFYSVAMMRGCVIVESVNNKANTKMDVNMKDKAKKSSIGPFAMIVFCTGMGWFLGGVNGAVFGATFWSGAVVIAGVVNAYKAEEEK